jgi:hypothetical protein
MEIALMKRLPLVINVIRMQSMGGREGEREERERDRERKKEGLSPSIWKSRELFPSPELS